MNTEARYVEEMDLERVRCALCPHRCVIKSGEAGVCNTRINHHGRLYAVNYGELTSVHVDPIEKKPLFHFMPGSSILSAGSFGCNFKCSFCQNYSISQGRAASQNYSVEELIELALNTENNAGIAFTYNEPLTLFEYVLDTFKTIKSEGIPLKTVLVTNGYINPEPLEELLPYVDAMNIDIKSMDPFFYKSICKGSLEPVLHTVARAAELGVHVEITTLMVAGHMDKPNAVEEVARFIASIDPFMPLHLSRYYPQYEMEADATDPAVMMQALAAAKKHLEYVYLGNLFDADVSTLCPNCGFKVVQRQAYVIHNYLKEKGTCPSCGMQVPRMVMDFKKKQKHFG